MTHICDYGCGQEAKHQFKNGKWCCSEYTSQCPAVRKKFSGENNSKGMIGKYPSKISIEKRAKKLRTPFEKIKKLIENKGWQLLTNKEEYEKNHPRKLWFRCPEGHEYPARWDGPKTGCVCPICSKKIVSNKLKTPFKKIIKFVEDKGYELLSKKEDYENACSKLWFRCPEDHEFPMNWSAFKNLGYRCPECAKKISRVKRRNPFEEIIKFTENEHYELLSSKKEYENQFSKLWFRCPEGHEYPASWNTFKNCGSRCPECFKKRVRYRMLNGGSSHVRSFLKRISKPQLKLFNKTKDLFPEATLEYPCLNYSIDIAIPSSKIAVEYDESYWHQDQEADDKRQNEIENEGWTFLRYRDYVPSKEELEKDIRSLNDSI